MPSASRATASGPGMCCSRASARSARCPGPTAWPRRRTRPRRTAPIDATVAVLARAGWPGPASPTTRCAPARAVGADHQGPDLHAHRRDGRRARRRRCRRRRVGSATGTTATPGCGTRTFTLQALHYLNLDWEADEFMQFVADLEPNQDGGLQIMYGIDGRRDLTESTRDDLSGYEGARPVRIGNGAFDQRQNDVFGAVLDSILLHTQPQPAPAAAAVAARQGAGRGRHRGLARARPGHLGGARQAAALRLVEADGLGRAGPGRQAGRDPRRRPTCRPSGRATADEIRADILAHGVSDRGRAAPALRHRRARRLDPAGGAVRVPAGHRRAAAQHA